MVRAFTHGAMGRRIDPSWSGPIDFTAGPQEPGMDRVGVGAIAHDTPMPPSPTCLYWPCNYIG